MFIVHRWTVNRYEHLYSTCYGSGQSAVVAGVIRMSYLNQFDSLPQW